MADDRDICERLECTSYDGAIFLRRNAAKEIRALRYYVARLEDDLAKAETDLEKAWGYSSKQAIDIVTLGQEVGRLREAIEEYVNTVVKMEGVTFVDQMENAELRAVIEPLFAEKEK